jgi:hypothetical protein
LCLLSGARHFYRSVMVSIFCDRFESEVLLGLESIDSIENYPDAIVVRFDCTCGTTHTRRFPKRVA